MSDVRRTRGQQGPHDENPQPKWHGKPRETYTEYHPTIENSSSAKTAKSKSRPSRISRRKTAQRVR